MTEKYIKSVTHFKASGGVRPEKYVGAGAGEAPTLEIEPEEKLDIIKSTGALGEQVKVNDKSKANANKAKGYAKAKSIGRKYG